MADPQGVQWSEHLQPQYLQDLGQRWNRGRALSRLPPASDWEWWGMFRPGQLCQCGPPLWDLVVPGFPAGLAKTFYKLYWSSIPPSFPHSLTMLVQQCDLKFSRHLVHPKDPWYLVILGAVQNVHKTCSTYQDVLDTWFCPFGMNQIWSDQISRALLCGPHVLWIFWIGPNVLQGIWKLSLFVPIPSPLCLAQTLPFPSTPTSYLCHNLPCLRALLGSRQILWCSILSVLVQYPQ